MTRQRERARGARKRPGRSKSLPAGEVRRPLILIAEDNADDRNLYAQYLRYDGFQVETVTDGATACRRAIQLVPDLVVMDLTLPRIDGWAATRELKGHPATAHVPIVACTGHAFGPAVERALDAGCDAYVVKPCLPADLADEIRRVLQRSALRRRA